MIFFKSKKLSKLENQIKQLRSFEEKRSEFLHIAAHQLKNPLAIIRFILIGLLNEKKITKKVKERLGEALFQSESVINFFDDIIKIIKTEANNSSVKKDYIDIDIEVIIKDVLNEFHELIIQKKIQINKHIGGVMPTIKTDPVFLKIAIANLIDNAIRYSKNHSRVNILINEVKDKLIEIKVQDFGIGIAHADRGRIFEKFFRGLNAKDHSPSGTGLGLYLVQLAIKKIGGRIDFKSIFNKGSEFIIKIPTNL